MSQVKVGLNRTWELSMYELYRTPQNAIADNTAITVSSRTLHSELMCPICLDMLKKTMTAKECLHRFCSECIVTALRSGNKECPTCRKKIVSKRSLRPDPNFDMLISKIFPSRDEYEAHQEKVLENLNKSHSQAALVNSIAEGIKLQSQNRQTRSRKNNGNTNQTVNQNQKKNNSRSSTLVINNADPNKKNAKNLTAPVPTAKSAKAISSSQPGCSTSSQHSQLSGCASSNVSSITKSTGKRSRSKMSEESESSEPTKQADTEGEELSEPLTLNEIELVFKPHPTEMCSDNHLGKALQESPIRYIKTSAKATVDHLHKYLATRMTLDFGSQCAQSINFCIHVSPSFGQYVQLVGNQTLGQVNDKYRNVIKPLELYYSWKRTQ